MITEYRTLDLRIREQAGQVSIEANGPNGEWVESPTAMPDEELQQTLLVRAKHRFWGSEDEQMLRDAGERLGKTLIPDRVYQLYSATLQRILTQPTLGLRLRLQFVGLAKAYQRLPWEYIHINGRSVAMDPRQSIVRTVDTLEPAISLAVDKPPYRILMVSAEPKAEAGFPPLTIEEEGIRVEEAFKSLIDQRLIQVEVHRNITLSQIERLLREGNFHVFHFIGYAQVPEHGDGVLIFVDETGDVDRVDGRRLGAVLLGTGVRMAFLNSNETAYGGESGVGVAESLLQVGLPIAVAHNYPVLVRAAIAFSSAFYMELAKANSVDQAMFVGRRAIAEVAGKADPIHWVNPVLFLRTQESRFWTGEAGYQIETFIKEGRLVAEAKQPGEFDAGSFTNRLQVALDSLERIQSLDSRLKAQQLIADARDAIASSNPELASQKLSEASTHIYLTVNEQERLEKDREKLEKVRLASIQRERRSQWTVAGVSMVLLLAVALLGYLLRDLWTPSMSIPVVGLPISVIVWSFVGGVAAMLQAFVGAKKAGARKVSYEWLLWRPIVGIIMGSVVYLAIAAGLVVLGQDDFASLANTRNSYLLWALAFLGGFSDKFTILVFDNIVRIYSKPQDEPAAGESEEPDSSSSDEALSK